MHGENRVRTLKSPHPASVRFRHDQLHSPLLLSLAAVVAACSSGDSSPPTLEPVTISGTILSPDGSAIGAIVELTRGSDTYEGVVDVQGHYTITNVPQGTYDLVIDGSTTIHPDGSKAAPLTTLRAPEFQVAPGALPFGTETLTLPEVGATIAFDLDSNRQALILAGTQVMAPGDGPALRFARSTVVTFPEGADGTLSVSEALPESMPIAPLAGEVSPVGGMIVSPVGLAFDVDPIVLLPNRGGLAPNTTGVEIVAFSPTGTGQVSLGTGTVDPDGHYVVPDAISALGSGSDASRGSTDWVRHASFLAANFANDNSSVTVMGTLRDGVGGVISGAEILVDSWSTSYLTATDNYSTEVGV